MINRIFGLLANFLSLFPTTLENNTRIHVVDVEHPLSIEQIKKKYTAFDIHDGNITDSLEFEIFDYDPKECTEGLYPVRISITNQKKKTETRTDYILVRDFVPPTLHLSQNNLTVYMEEQISRELILDFIEFSDNRDSSYQDLIIDGFPQAPIEAGIYDLSVSVTDSSDNLSNQEHFLLQIEDSHPVTVLSLTLHLNGRGRTQNDIIQMFLKENIISSPYQQITAESDYFSTEQTNGTFPVLLSVVMEDGTRQTYSFKIELKEKKSLWTFLWIGIGGGVFLIVMTIGIVIYRKRSQ